MKSECAKTTELLKVCLKIKSCSCHSTNSREQDRERESCVEQIRGWREEAPLTAVRRLGRPNQLSGVFMPQGEGSQDVGLPLRNLEIGTLKSASSNRASTFFYD